MAGVSSADRPGQSANLAIMDCQDLGGHKATGEVPPTAALPSEKAAVTRLESARERDATANERDLVALGRDQAAAARDLAMAQRDVDTRESRVQSAEHRAQAARDREAAAMDREQAARDRRDALADREALAQELALTEIDPLTGARARAAGLTDIDHELDRSRRTGSTLVVVYVDAVGLKRLNDSEGHHAGDRLLQRVVALTKEHLRPYDLIVRLAGDEFLCAMSNMTLTEARRRFSTIAGALAASSDGGALRTGFAELTGDETSAELIARADSELIHRGRALHTERRARH